MLAACGARATRAPGAQPGAPGAQPDAPSTRRYKITIVEAALKARRPEGGPWHVQPADDSMQLLGGLVGLALGYPELGMGMGALLDQGERIYPPSPFVEIKIGATTLTTRPAGPTLSPRWRYPMALDITGYALSEPVVVLVRDAVDEGVIAQTHFPLAELLARPLMRLVDLDGVATLDIAIEPLPAVPPAETYQVTVPANASPEWLIQHENPDAMSWQRIPLLNGDIVRIHATGAICPSSWEPSACYDAGGAPGRWSSYNRPGFASVPHGALIGLYADIGITVGTYIEFRAEKSGWLTLFVNDTDLGNNAGAFHVSVEVNPVDLIGSALE
jgi:hypothetical protein